MHFFLGGESMSEKPLNVALYFKHWRKELDENSIDFFFFVT